jgi:protein subunit release factor B
MPTANITPARRKALEQRMSRMGIREGDLEEKFVRASGPGGQKVNKSSSCVQLRHIPTGLMVRCQRERSQALNRYIARCRLLDRIEKERNGFVAAEMARINRIRRQKRKRSKRAREKMLSDKRIASKKKDLRKTVSRNEE